MWREYAKNIFRCISGKRETAFGYLWAYHRIHDNEDPDLNTVIGRWMNT